MNKWIIGLWLVIASGVMATDVVLTPENISQFYVRSSKKTLYEIKMSKGLTGEVMYTTSWHSSWYTFDAFVISLSNWKFELVKKNEIKFKLVEVQ